MQISLRVDLNTQLPEAAIKLDPRQMRLPPTTTPTIPAPQPTMPPELEHRQMRLPPTTNPTNPVPQPTPPAAEDLAEITACWTETTNLDGIYVIPCPATDGLVNDDTTTSTPRTATWTPTHTFTMRPPPPPSSPPAVLVTFVTSFTAGCAKGSPCEETGLVAQALQPPVSTGKFL